MENEKQASLSGEQDSQGRGEKPPVFWGTGYTSSSGDGLVIARPTPWDRGKSSWGPWNGLVRGMLVSFRREMVVFVEFGDSGCVEGM